LRDLAPDVAALRREQPNSIGLGSGSDAFLQVPRSEIPHAQQKMFNNIL
jgi:hypothetical protein